VDRTGEWQQVVDSLAEVPPHAHGPPPLQVFLRHLLDSGLVSSQELKSFLDERPGLGEEDTPLLAEALVNRGVLNDYQRKRVLAGQTFGLVLGNYRILDWLGSGGMGTVYKAEHVHMKRPVALKVLLGQDDENSVFLQRFSSEMQALAVLRHPNIVLAFDAGEVPVPGEGGRKLCYLVMEYVSGQDLEQYVLERGPLPVAVACDFIRQAANGLRHAHEHGLIHRDVKPSNLLVTSTLPGAAGPNGLIKILDFGLARLYRRRCTAAHAVLGTVDYMAPEQARDARSVDIRADIYGLGGTLYWLLTGQRPFPGDRPPVQELLARQHETPVPPRSLRPDIPLELEAILCQMMARDPADRYPTPLAVIAALDEFLEPSSYVVGPTSTGRSRSSTTCRNGTLIDPLLPVPPSEALAGSHTRRILIVSPRADRRVTCRSILNVHGFACTEASHDGEVRAALQGTAPDVVLVDGHLAEGPGADLCRRLRAEAPAAHLKLLLLTDSPEEEGDAEVLCDDQVPLTGLAGGLLTRVRLAVRLKDAEERADRLASHLLATNGQLEQVVQQRDNTAHQAQDVLIFAMAKMAELRGQETGAHLLRMQQYVRVLAEEAMRLPAFAGCIDDSFIRMLERGVLLHDIGKVAIPDHILLKPGKLDREERSIMESHTVLGASLLEQVARQHGACLAFLNMAIEVVRHHHERHDGSGYPDGLKGDAIPLSARIVALADVYDALRSKLVYKPGLSHTAVCRLLLAPDQGQFDPALLVAFRQCEVAFKQVFEQTTD
jgi:response regulator RpfG family c-di-GMP phosphodiesterase/serine/threonine protein kinase